MRSILLTHRVMSVSCGGIVYSKNLLVPIGTPMEAIVEYWGGRKTADRYIGILPAAL